MIKEYRRGERYDSFIVDLVYRLNPMPRTMVRDFSGDFGRRAWDDFIKACFLPL